MKSIFKLVLSEWWHAKSWIIILCLFGASIFVAPFLVPSSLDYRLIPMTRAQILYGITMVFCAIYIPLVASEFGRIQVTRHARLFWKAQGISDCRYFVALCLAAGIPLLGLIVMDFVMIAIFGGRTSIGFGPLGMVSLLQASVLTGLAFFIAIPFCIGISQRTSSAFAFLSGCALNLAGLYLPAALEVIRENEQVGPRGKLACEVISGYLLPQIRIGDQAERITFGWEAMPMEWWAIAITYLLIWVFLLSVIGYGLFRKST